MSVTLLVSLGSVISVQAWKGKWDKLKFNNNSQFIGTKFQVVIILLFVIAN